MTISPNVSAILNLLAALVALVVGAAAEWTTLFGAGTSATIVADASIIAALLTAINSVLHGTSAPTAGALASRQH
jgi:hypothetical protein